MKTLKKLWSTFNGKKTTIGMIIVLVSQGFKVFAPNLIPKEQLDFIETTGMIIGGGGLLHKGIKNEKINQALSRATNK